MRKADNLTAILCHCHVIGNLNFLEPSGPLQALNGTHHHMSVMQLGHLLTRSGLTYPEVSSEVCHDSFCQLRNSVSLSWAVCHEAFCLHAVSSSSCIPAVCLEPVLFLIPLQCVICPVSLREACQWLKYPLNVLTDSEQGKSSGRNATFSLWTGMFRDGISFIPGETVIPL